MRSAAPDVNVASLIRASTDSFADSVLVRELAVRDERGLTLEREFTYGAVRAMSERIAAALMTRGLVPGARVAVLLENRTELVVTEWACLLSGLVWVGLNVRISAAELQEVLDDCVPGAFVYSSSSSAAAETVRLHSNCVRVSVDDGSGWHEMMSAGESALARGFELSDPSAEDPVRIRYTSGTAGKPKGALLPRRSYDASFEAVGRVLAPLREDDVVLQVAPMTHASGAMLLPHVGVGAKAVVLRSFDPEALIETIEREQVTATFLVPTMLIRLLEALDDPARVSTLRTIVYGGAPMPVDRLRHALDRLGPVLVQIYGLTESTWPVCALTRDDHERRKHESEARWVERLHSCGRPTDVGVLEIVGANGTVAGIGEIGEILVRGRNTMLGYFAPAGRRAVTDEKGLDSRGWMRTGDLGFVDAEGLVTIVDRLHDMIVSGGFNVYPTEVESALSKHPAVLEAAVIGRPDPQWGEAVHAAIVLKPGATVTADAIVAHCARLLASYKKPRTLEFVDSLPKNASGKVMRRAIRDRYSAATA